MSERWLPVPGYEGLYEVSDLGRVRSLDRILTSASARQGYPRKLRGRILCPQKHSAGYLQVGLAGNNKLISNLVLEAFKGPRPPGEEACHNDGDKHNNAFCNLRWATHVDNCADRTPHGTQQIGEKNAQAKLTESDVRKIRSSPMPWNLLAVAYGVRESHIGRVKRRERWAHVG